MVTYSAAHGYTDGQFIKLSNIAGMTELNGNVYCVKNPASTTLQLYQTDGVTPVDSTGYGTYSGPGGSTIQVVKTITGLGDFEGATLSIFAEGAKMSDQTVVESEITIDDYVSQLHWGLPYTPNLQPQRFTELPTHYKRIDHITLRLYESLGAKVGENVNHLDDIPYESGDPPAFFTGDKEIPFRGGYNRDGDILITQPYPLPLSILALFINSDTTEI